MIGAAAASALVALAAHVVYWYLPRERTATLDRASAAGELFATGSQSVRVWLAYPHQNLAAASGALDEPAAALAAAARLAGLGTVEIPAFGPFAVPPSRAIAIGVERGGEDFAVAVEVFPALAVLARVAGVLAGNPILRGGQVDLSGREVNVAWRGMAWTLRSVERRRQAGEDRPAELPAAPSGALSVAPALALVVLAEPMGAVEAGVYTLLRDGRDLVLGSAQPGGSARAAELVEARAREHDLALLGLRVEAPAGASLLVMPRAGGQGLRLPDAAVATEGGVERWRLPGEEVLRLLGIEPVEARAGDWSVLAIEQESLEIAVGLAPELGTAAAGEQVSLLLWVRRRDYLPLVAAVSTVLDRLPFAPREEVERWRDLRTLLETLHPIERLRVVVAAGLAEARLDVSAR